MPVIFSILVPKFQVIVHADEVGSEQSFIDVTQLPDFKGTVVNGLVRTELYLPLIGARRWLGEDQLSVSRPGTPGVSG